ncbi:hypothetical protein [Streptomyces sp. 184]|uniref:hypothetical protein n=1 Tax=Streptomyces sp. 184 TaxID=1827526 RepID=UPI003892986B
MPQTIVFSFLTGLMGTNALPHLVKGLAGEEFPNLWGNSPLRNALAGVSGIALTVLFVFLADMPGHPWAAAVATLAGAYLMAAFHGLHGAFWLNTVTGNPNPATPANRGPHGA